GREGGRRRRTGRGGRSCAIAPILPRPSISNRGPSNAIATSENAAPFRRIANLAHRGGVQKGAPVFRAFRARKTGAVCVQGIFARRYKLKIGYAVIGFDAIDMVDLQAFGNRPVNAFPNQAMSHHAKLPVSAYLHIAATPLPNWLAFESVHHAGNGIDAIPQEIRFHHATSRAFCSSRARPSHLIRAPKRAWSLVSYVSPVSVRTWPRSSSTTPIHWPETVAEGTEWNSTFWCMAQASSGLPSRRTYQTSGWMPFSPTLLANTARMFKLSSRSTRKIAPHAPARAFPL